MQIMLGVDITASDSNFRVVGVKIGIGGAVQWAAANYQGSNFPTSKFYSVSFNGSDLWLALAVESAYTSPDGINWTRTATLNFGASSILWDGSKFVILSSVGGSKGNITTTVNGISFTTSVLLPFDTGVYGPSVLGFGNGMYIAAAYADLGSKTGFTGNFCTSTDLINWTSQTGFSNVGFSSIIHDGSYFVASTNGDNTNNASYPQVAYSSDGVNWVANNITTFSTQHGVSLGYLGGTYILVGTDNATGNSAYAETSLNRNWASTSQTSPFLSDGPTQSGSVKFVICDSYNNQAASSTDGVNWRLEALTVSTIGTAFGKGKVIAVGTNTQGGGIDVGS